MGPSSWAVRSEKRGGIPIQSKRAALRLAQHFGRSNRASSRRLVGSMGGAFSRALQVGQHATHARLALLGAGQRIPALGLEIEDLLLAPIVQLVRSSIQSVEWAIFISEWQLGLQGYYAVKRIGDFGDLGRNVIGLCRLISTLAICGGVEWRSDVAVMAGVFPPGDAAVPVLP